MPPIFLEIRALRLSPSMRNLFKKLISVEKSLVTVQKKHGNEAKAYRFYLLPHLDRSRNDPLKEQHMDRRHLSIDSCSPIREDSGHSTELNKKRKLSCGHTDLGLGSQISKQKRENQQETELPESSENSVTFPFLNHDHNIADPYMEHDWYCTSSSCYSNEATSSGTLGSSTEFNSSASTDISVPEGIEYSCRKGLLKELQALHDPVITKHVKSSMVVCEDPDGDMLDSMLYSNGLDELVTPSASGGAMQMVEQVRDH